MIHECVSAQVKLYENIITFWILFAQTGLLQLNHCMCETVVRWQASVRTIQCFASTTEHAQQLCQHNKHAFSGINHV